MENVKAYIESGILELYVLGDVSPEEKLQVEDMASKYPDVKAELTAIEESMEFYAKGYAIEPSEGLRGRILNSLVTNLADDRVFTKERKHASEEQYEDDNIVSLPKRVNFFKYAFAACLTLLIISIYGLVNLYSKLQDSNSQLTALQLDKERMANQVNLMDNELNVYRSPSYKVLKLQGTEKNPTSAMTVAWNTGNKMVMVDMKSMKMPKHDKSHQFQLWALVSGKPVDLGVFDAPSGDTVTTSSIKEMKAIAAADAFAVTLEPAGGSINPTLDQMVVIGKF